MPLYWNHGTTQDTKMGAALKITMSLFAIVFSLSSFAENITIDIYPLGEKDSKSSVGNMGALKDGRLGLAMNVTNKDGISRYVVRAGDVNGQFWLNLDEFQLAEGKSASAYGVAAGKENEIWSSGVANDQDSASKCVVRKSVDGGKTWATDLVFPEKGEAFCYSMATTTTAAFVTGGYIDPDTNTQNWLVLRKEFKEGAQWAVVDNFYTEGTAVSAATSINNVIFASGHAVVDGIRRVVTRRSDDGGSSWKTVDLFFADSETPGSRSFSVAANPDSPEVFTCGFSRVANGILDGFMVRRGSDNGQSWQTVLDLKVPSSEGSHTSNCNGISLNKDGVIVAVGNYRYIDKPFSYSAFISFDEGSSWKLIDQYGGLKQINASGFRSFSFGEFFFTNGTEKINDTDQTSFIRRISY